MQRGDIVGQGEIMEVVEVSQNTTLQAGLEVIGLQPKAMALQEGQRVMRLGINLLIIVELELDMTHLTVQGQKVGQQEMLMELLEAMQQGIVTVLLGQVAQEEGDVEEVREVEVEEREVEVIAELEIATELQEEEVQQEIVMEPLMGKLAMAADHRQAMHMELQVETRVTMVMEVYLDTVTKESIILEDEMNPSRVKFSN